MLQGGKGVGWWVGLSCDHIKHKFGRCMYVNKPMVPITMSQEAFYFICQDEVACGVYFS